MLTGAKEDSDTGWVNLYWNKEVSDNSLTLTYDID